MMQPGNSRLHINMSLETSSFHREGYYSIKNVRGFSRKSRGISLGIFLKCIFRDFFSRFSEVIRSSLPFPLGSSFFYHPVQPSNSYFQLPIFLSSLAAHLIKLLIYMHTILLINKQSNIKTTTSSTKNGSQSV